MTSFYLAALVLVLAALAFALWPLLSHRFKNRSTGETSVNRHSANVALYEDQLDELKKQLERADISQSQYDELQVELGRNLLQDNPTKTETLAATHASKPLYWWLVVALVPVGVYLLYQTLGSWQPWQLKQQLDQQLSLQQQFLQTGNPALKPQLDAANKRLLASLKVHTQQSPEDLESKLMLARLAVSEGDFDLAIASYQQILEQEPKASQVMAELAQSVFVQAGNKAVPVVGMLAAQALNIQPNNVMALGLAGISAYQNENYAEAIKHWQLAVTLQPPTSENARAMQNGIAQAQARLAASGQSIEPENQDDKAASKKVKVAVSLGDQAPADPNHAVFIYARAWQGAKMPLAITRLTAAQLPITLELDESMSMAPGMSIATVDKLELVARLSPSGNAIAQPGDWQVTLGPVNAQASPTTVYPLVIAEPLP